MSALDVEESRRLLRDQLLTASPLPAAPFQAWENRPFETPPVAAGNEWFRESLVVLSEVLEAFEMTTVLGIVTYDVFAPKGEGTETIGAITEAIKTVMKPGQNLVNVSATCKIHIFRSERGAGRTDTFGAAWYTVPVTVFWRAHVITPHTP